MLERTARPSLALGLAVLGLAACLAWFMSLSHEGLFDPLTLVLTASATVANASAHRFGDRVVSGSFVCSLIGLALLGPASAVAIELVSEVIDWCLKRFSPRLLIENLCAILTSTLVAAAGFSAMTSGDGWLALDSLTALAITGVLLLVMSTSAHVSLMSLRTGYSVAGGMSGMRPFLPVLALHVAAAVWVTDTYSRAGLDASVLLLVVVLAFNYTTGLVITARERSRQAAKLAASRGRLVARAADAEERERRSLAERLHDGPIQNLLAARQDLEEARESDDEAGVRRAAAAVERTVTELRETVFELHPAVLEQAGLEAALRSVAERQARRAGYRPKVLVAHDALGHEDELLFSLGRELLSNVSKHARASRVDLTIDRVGDELVLQVIDDGCGIDEGRRREAVAEGHIGLASAAERVEVLGGELSASSPDEGGTVVRVTVPVRQALSEGPRETTSPATAPGRGLAQSRI